MKIFYFFLYIFILQINRTIYVMTVCGLIETEDSAAMSFVVNDD